jgi:hypothetical protein
MAPAPGGSDPFNDKAEWYNRNWGTAWNLRQTPRQVRRLARDWELAQLLMSAQPILGYTPVTDLRLTQTGRNHTVHGVTAGLSNVNVNNINYRQSGRSGGASKEAWGRHWGPAPFHHIVDPTRAPLGAGFSPIAQDLINLLHQAGDSWMFFGFWSFVTTNDETSKTGAGWWSNSTDRTWVCGVYEGTAAPTTTVFEMDSGVTSHAEDHRPAIVLNAELGSFDFYLDGALERYTPSAPLGQMAACPSFGYFGITNTGADGRIRHLGGANPRLLSLLPVN